MTDDEYEFELTVSFGEAPDELVLAIDDDHRQEHVFEPTLEELSGV